MPAAALTPLSSDLSQKLLPLFKRWLIQNNRLLRFFSHPDLDMVVERFWGWEGVNEGFWFEVDCLSRETLPEAHSLLGTEVGIGLLQADGRYRHWYGGVSSVTLMGGEGALLRYRLVLQPWLNFLAHRYDARIFKELDAIEIVQQVVAI